MKVIEHHFENNFIVNEYLLLIYLGMMNENIATIFFLYLLGLDETIARLRAERLHSAKVFVRTELHTASLS